MTKAGLTVVGTGSAALAYALWEAKQYRVREVRVPVLPAGARPVRILQLTDLHLTPRQESKQRWLEGLAALEPDLLVLTGDLLGHMDAVPHVSKSLAALHGVPGFFVFGSNDYWAPKPINPLKYFNRDREPRMTTRMLPTEDLRSELINAGWTDLNNHRATLAINGFTVDARGVDDPHIRLDDYAAVAGPFDPGAGLRLGVVHAPYLRVLDPMAADGPDLILAGHTHGGQVCVPGYGALVTNCDLNPARASGLSAHEGCALHVSAGLGTNPYAPIRLACPPEASLLHLVPREG